jgi:hypothetical protein
MPGPQFLTPKPVSSSAHPRRFTVAQANKSLPLVKRIVEDIVRTHEKVSALQAAVAAAKPKEQPGIQSELDKAIEQLQNYVDELHEIGVDLKDFQMGLVDFLGRHQGRDVSLCWKLGEPSIAYWHELQTGFAGRQPVSQIEED